MPCAQRHLQLSSRHAIDTFVTGNVQVAGPKNTEEPTVLSRGLQVRAVIDQSFLGEPSAADNVDESLARGMRIRTVDGVPLKLIVCDGEMAMLPLGGSGSEVDPSLVLRGGLANVARALFDAVWERACPYGEPHRGSMSWTPAYCVFCSPASPTTRWPHGWTCRGAPCSGASRG
ncbi:hypothetical protein [Streptomyces sp. BE133]|uniref:hypothetical protein n=1 Tax=Streptomyces sp. BE133 TaxID=3002523 RepID=UPI002E79B7B8|nr:hypothetical protein [Streptomyces sp. BE133]MEE1808131.1 hypothetical protein [Streptomyces sp. BE133]